ncbi:ATP-binding protein [Nakamurella lactea]|uniref:ATP-binding protein n=1 Tax=Nakamurella lactea TaxID=459515 RepID=UPI000406F019|nr:AAA family ATPase [Nakamurella lactea]
MRFAERERELAGLATALDRARLGGGTIVLVSGEAGIGKTSLLARFTDLVEARTRVFRGTCEDLLTPRPLGPFRDMARDANGALGTGILDDRDALIDSLVTEMSFVQRPAVVIVEDIQWADQASLDVLRFLARRVAGLPALLVVSYREPDLADEHPLLRVVASIPAAAVLRLPLTGLSDTAVAMLASEAGVDPAPIVARVGGNPFYLSEVIAAPATEVPISIRHAVIGRMATLPADCRAAVEDLSVVVAEIGWALITRLFGDVAVLDPAERQGILVPSYAGMHFRHELARRAVEDSLRRSRAITAHRQVLAALIELGADPSQLVHHAMAVGDDDALVEHAERAAEQAAQVNGHREVIRFCTIALEHGRLAGARRAGLHVLAAAAHYSSNEFSAAVGHADRAVDLLRDNGLQPLQLGEALLMSARIRTLLAEPRMARTLALQAVELLEPLGPSKALALGVAMLAAQDTVQARYADAADRVERAVQLARLVEAEDVVAYALNYRGVARSSQGDDRGIADLQRSIAIAERLRQADYETVAAHNLAVIHLRAGRVGEAEPLLVRARSVAREHNLDNALFRIEAQLCLCQLLRGEWSSAEAGLREQLAGATDAGAVAVNPLSLLGRILCRRGDPAGVELLEQAWRLAVASGEDQKLSVAAAARIENCWLTDDPVRLRAEANSALPIIARAGNRFGQAEVLRYLRRTGTPVEPFTGCPPPFAAGLRGDWAEAARLWALAGNPYEQALELSESPDPAVVFEALELFDRLGATVPATRTRRRLRQAGISGVPRGPRPSTRANPGLLTGRQREVVTLLAQELTNAEIAQRLVLSPRTVDNHVAVVLQRLGVGSRTEAVRAARRLGLLPDRPMP